MRVEWRELLQLRLAIDAAGMGTWDLCLRTGEAVWSDGYFRMLGYPAEPDHRANAEMWRSRVHPEDLAQVMQALEDARREHTLYRPRHRVIRADDGRVIWLQELRPVRL